MKPIRNILTGKKYFSTSLTEVLANVIESGGPKTLHDPLSVREYLAVCAIAAGESVSQIAEEMSLSVKTVSTYRARAHSKK